MSNYRKSIDKIKPYVPGKPVEEVKRQLGLKRVYKLASNEIPFPPNYIRQAINKELIQINRYPEAGSFYLRQKVAQKHKVSPEQIVFGNGSDELITLTIRAFLSAQDQIIVAYPTFLIYELQALVQGANVKRIPLKNFRYDLAAIAKAVNKKTKIIFIANPDNPTGSYINAKELKQFLAKIPQDILVFLDEAYFEFAPQDFPCSAEILKNRGNVIFTRTFSKAYGLAGLRIGYGISSIEIAAVLNRIREPFNINRFAQVAALAALKNRVFLKKVVSYVQREKKYLYAQLKVLGVDFVPSATNFILVDFKKDTGCLNEFLMRQGIIIREMKGWGLTNFFRVTLGLHKENQEFIRQLKQYLIQEKK